jgi:hypothetical protein
LDELTAKFSFEPYNYEEKEPNNGYVKDRAPLYVQKMHNSADNLYMEPELEEDVRIFVDSEPNDANTLILSNVDIFDSGNILGTFARQSHSKMIDLMEYEFFAFDCREEFDEPVDNQTIFNTFFNRLKSKCQRIYLDFEQRVKEIYMTVDRLADHMSFRSMFSTKQCSYKLDPPNFYIGTTSSCDEKIGLAGLSQREMDLFILYSANMLRTEHVDRLVKSSARLHAKFMHMFSPLQFQEVFDMKLVSIRAALDASIVDKPFYDENGLPRDHDVGDLGNENGPTKHDLNLYRIVVLIKKPVLNLSQFNMKALHFASEHVKNLKYIQAAQFNLCPDLAMKSEPQKFDENCAADFYVSGAQSMSSERFEPKKFRKNLQTTDLTINSFELHGL